MQLNSYSDSKDALRQLQQRGFIDSFKLKPGGLLCKESGQIYPASEIRIVEYHRFTEEKKGKENRIIFAVKTLDGKRGILKSPSRTREGIQLLQFMDKVKIERKDNRSSAA